MIINLHTFIHTYTHKEKDNISSLFTVENSCIHVHTYTYMCIHLYIHIHTERKIISVHSLLWKIQNSVTEISISLRIFDNVKWYVKLPMKQQFTHFIIFKSHLADNPTPDRWSRIYLISWYLRMDEYLEFIYHLSEK